MTKLLLGFLASGVSHFLEVIDDLLGKQFPQKLFVGDVVYLLL